MRLPTTEDIHFIDYKTRDKMGFEIYVSLFPIVFQNYRASTKLDVLDLLLEDVSTKLKELKCLENSLIKKRQLLTTKPKRKYVRKTTK